MTRTITARYPGTCATCGQPIPAGETVAWDTETKKISHLSCEAVAVSKVAPAPTSSGAPEPTGEQKDALAKFTEGGHLVIEAGAGTGKTTTLRQLAESTTRRGQYLAFNRAIVKESERKMPSNVKCNTAHSLAFRHVGHKYAHRLNSGRMRSYDIALKLGIEPLVLTLDDKRKKVMQATYLAGLVMRSVVRFCQTADEVPGREHVPFIEGIDEIADGVRSYTLNREVAKWIEPAIREAWADLTDIDGSLPFRHEHYLKMWQLDHPKIDAEFILFDEAQDANPVMVAVVAEQAGHAQLVWVGDSQQQIYTFTGAVNALQTMPFDNRTFLTQSFRFGPAVADEANRVLTMLDADLRITGTDSIHSTVGPVASPDAILTRTNASAVREVLNAQRNGVAVHLVGGGTEIVSFAKAADRLQRSQSADHPELACFESWEEVQEYVQNDEQGAELRLMTTLVDDFGVPTILAALDKMIPESRASLVVSTAHKSKGREWQSVRLGDDFPFERRSDEELRLLYVAVTRARRQLDISLVALLNGMLGEEA